MTGSTALSGIIDEGFPAAIRPNRLRKNSCFVSGHDFSRAINDLKIRRPLESAREPGFVSGHDFSRAVKD